MKKPAGRHLGYWIGLLFVFLLVLANLPAGQAGLPQPQAQTLNATKKAASINQKITLQKTTTADKNLFLVTRVIDGDTIELADGRRVRYLGIDTPESVDPKKPVQCLAQASAAKNKELVLGKKVSLIYDQEKIDKYSRTLAYVFIGDDFINLDLVDLGLARAYPYAPNFLHRQDFADAQARAQQKKLGLWSGVCDDYISTATSGTASSNQPLNPNCKIKGNISAKGEKIYHLPGQKYYNQTRVDEDAGEKYFCSERDASAAGWRKSNI